MSEKRHVSLGAKMNWDEMRSVNEANLNKLVNELADIRAERMKILAGMKLLNSAGIGEFRPEGFSDAGSSPAQEQKTGITGFNLKQTFHSLKGMSFHEKSIDKSLEKTCSDRHARWDHWGCQRADGGCQ